MGINVLEKTPVEVFEYLEANGRINGSLAEEHAEYKGYKKLTPAQIYRLSLMCAKQQGIIFESEPLYFFLDNKKVKLIKATAGSGKTTISCFVIDKLIRYEGIKSNEICMLSYNKESVRDLKRRMTYIRETNNLVTRPYGVYVPVERIPNIRSIDSLSYNLVDQFSKELGYSKINIISALDSKLRMQKVLNNFAAEHHFEVTDDLSDKLVSLYDKRNYELKELEDLAHTTLFKSIGLPLEVVENILFSYSSKLKIESYLHFSDTARIIVEHAKKNKPFREYLRKLYRAILIDEVQDITECTFQFLMFLVGTDEVPEEEKNMLMVVGDDDQAIYRFKGARPHNCELLKEALNDAEIYYLSLNRRCPENILAYARCITDQIKNRDPMPLRSNKDGGLVDSQTYTLKSEVVNEIVNLGKTTKKETLRNICVGYRNNVTCFALVNKFLENGIPFKIRDDYMPGSDKLSVALDSVFNLLRQPDNSEMIASHLNKITCCSKSKKYKTVAKYSKYIESVMSECDAEFFWEIPIDKLECRDPDKLEEQFEQLEKLSKRLKRNVALDKLLPDFWSLFCESYWNYMRRFYKFDSELENLIYDMYNVPKSLIKLKMEREAQKEAIRSYVEADMGIQLCTMHGLKGLEFDDVYLIELEEGVFPAINENEIETKEDLVEVLDDELRLFYVGVTRAKKAIHLRWSSEKKSIFKEIDDNYFANHDTSMMGALTPKEEIVNVIPKQDTEPTKTFVVKARSKETILDIFSDENIKQTFDLTLMPCKEQDVEFSNLAELVKEEEETLNNEVKDEILLDSNLIGDSDNHIDVEDNDESGEDISLDSSLFNEDVNIENAQDEVDLGVNDSLSSVSEDYNLLSDLKLEDDIESNSEDLITDLDSLLNEENTESANEDSVDLLNLEDLIEETKLEVVGEQKESLIEKGMQTVNSMKEFTELIKRENGDLDSYLYSEIQLEDDEESYQTEDSRIGQLKEDYLNEYEIDDNKNELQNTLNLICKLI